MSKFIEAEINVIRTDLEGLGVRQNGEDIKISLDLSRVESYRPTCLDGDAEMIRTLVVMHSGYDFILNIDYSEFDKQMKSFMSPTYN